MTKRLSATFVKHAKPGKREQRYYDEHGLILRVRPSGGKQWMWRGTVHGKRVDLGLGGYPYTSLAEARAKAFRYRKLSREGRDPRHSEGRRVPTFEQLAERVIAIHAKNWRGTVNERQWRNSLRTYAFPRIGALPVNKITGADVLAVLEANDLWTRKAETARRVKQRVGAVLKYAVAKGYRKDNPVDAIGVALPKNGNRKRHFKALPHAEVAGALETVRNSGAWTGTKLAIEYMVLTATRPGETRLATWDEVDLESATWTIPESRSKTRKPHRVPLSPRALKVLSEAQRIRGATGLIFPSVMGKAAANVTYTKLLRELGIPCVSHGFRTSFRTWCQDTAVPRDLAEMCLAHVVRNPVEAAYARGTMFARRRTVMADWAVYVQ